MSKSEKNYFELTFPIRPYLKKYILRTSLEGNFQMKKSDCHFSAIILEPIKKAYVKTSIREIKHLTEKLTICMPPNIVRENKFTIDEQTIMSIDQRLRSAFVQQLCDFVLINKCENRKKVENIKRFLMFYNIHEDDLKLDTAIKMTQRRDDKLKPKNSPDAQYSFF